MKYQHRIQVAIELEHRFVDTEIKTAIKVILFDINLPLARQIN